MLRQAIDPFRNGNHARHDGGGGNVHGFAAQGLLGAVHLLALLTFYRMTVDSSSLAVSAVWLLYGCGFLMRRFNRWTAVKMPDQAVIDRPQPQSDQRQKGYLHLPAS